MKCGAGAGGGEVEVGLVGGAVGGAVELLGGEEVDRAVASGHSPTAADRERAAVFGRADRVPVFAVCVGDRFAGVGVAGAFVRLRSGSGSRR